jgi:hypothetical protein
MTTLNTLASCSFRYLRGLLPWLLERWKSSVQSSVQSGVVSHSLATHSFFAGRGNWSGAKGNTTYQVQRSKKSSICNTSFLTIEKELDVSESPEYQKIKQDNRILQAETARHVVERSELQDLRAEIEKLKAEKRDMVDAHWVTVAENDKKNNLLNTITSKR